ncbi:MAG TPA: hypothetical protein VEH30_03660 [Terriglobales bacterium]|nr:hypothetical protein [Terriglobales bacterium]
MTIELTRKHVVLSCVLFLTEFVGLWITIARSPDLQVFANHVGSVLLALWLIPFCAGSAFLTAVIILELLRVVGKPH